MTPQECIYAALNEASEGKNGGIDDIIRAANWDTANIAVYVLLDAGWKLTDDGRDNRPGRCLGGPQVCEPERGYRCPAHFVPIDCPQCGGYDIPPKDPSGYVTCKHLLTCQRQPQPVAQPGPTCAQPKAEPPKQAGASGQAGEPS